MGGCNGRGTDEFSRGQRSSSWSAAGSLRLSHVRRRPISVASMGGPGQMPRFASLDGAPVPVERAPRAHNCGWLGCEPQSRSASTAGRHGKRLERLSSRRRSSGMSEPRSLCREGRPTIQGNAFGPHLHSAPRVCTRAGRDLRSVRCTLGSPSEVEGVVADAARRWADMPATLTLRPGAVSR